MKYNGRGLRHELKYVINYGEYTALKSRLSAVLRADEHCGEDGYFIRSLYFDDVYGTALAEKEAGVQFRRKYRVRIYDLDDSVIKLEQKDKFGEYISKLSMSITKDEFYALTRGGDISFLLGRGEQIADNVYVDMRTRLLAPAVIVDYRRDVFIADEGNVRITFDRDLSAGLNTSDIFRKNIPSVRVFGPDTMILEVKYDDYLPSHIRKLLQMKSFSHEAASKYVYCRQEQMKFNPNSRYFLFDPFEGTVDREEKEAETVKVEEILAPPPAEESPAATAKPSQDTVQLPEEASRFINPKYKTGSNKDSIFEGERR